MKTVRNILTIIAVSAFLFACEADQDIYNDENVIEEVEAFTEPGLSTGGSLNGHDEDASE